VAGQSNIKWDNDSTFWPQAGLLLLLFVQLKPCLYARLVMAEHSESTATGEQLLVLICWYR
jgi:hypothetical protein